MLPDTPHPAVADSRSTALIAIFSLPLIWGTTFSIVQRALLDVSPLAFVVIRFGFAGLTFLMVSKTARRGLWIFLRPRGKAQRRYQRDVLILAAAIGGGYIFQTVGLLTTSSSKSAFLTSTPVIWTPLFAWLMGRERITPQLVIAVLVTLMGIFLMTHPFSHQGIVIGDVLTLGCAFAFAVYIVWIERTMPNALRFTGNENEATIMVTSSQIVVSAILFLVLLPLVETPRVHLTPIASGALVYTGILATSVTAYLQTRYQHHVTPSTASIIYMLEPVTAAAIAGLFLKEQMGMSEVLGGGLIILGVIIAQWKLRTARSAPEAV